MMDPATLIHHFLEKSAARYPEKPALIQEGRRTSYRELNTLADRFAGCLREHGLGPGARVVLLLENSLEYAASYYGLLKIGAVAVPCSPDLKSDQIRQLLGRVEPKAVVASAQVEKILQGIDLGSFNVEVLILKKARASWSSRFFRILSWEESVSGAGSGGGLRVEPADLSTILFTSGSAGKPKGVMLSHENIVANTLAICRYLEIGAADIQMVVLPFFYVMGLSLLNTHVAAGGTLVLNNKFAFPAAVLREMMAEQVTGFAGVPSTYAYLLNRSPLPKMAGQLTSLRYCTQAGGHLPRELKERLRQALPGHIKIFIMYGATEASARLAYLSPERYGDKMDSVGRAIPGVQLRVVAPGGEEVPRGMVGELVATGPNIMQGYWKDPEGTRQVLKGRAYRTGDLAYMDAEGFIFIVGRKDHQIKIGGHRLNPQEIEDVLYDSGFLAETVVLGVDDKLWGEKMAALIVAK
ncbi:MAG: acyl--CoA ligase, partial [Deltaproteobacteria bacterium]|nr:acyl--CoA ligase [Deltaproteobacteria bacterium]